MLCNGSWSFSEIWASIAEALGRPAPKRRIPIGVLKTVSAQSSLFTLKAALTADFLGRVSLDWGYDGEKARRELGLSPEGLSASLEATWKAS